jgi:hypothetical protein
MVAQAAAAVLTHPFMNYPNNLQANPQEEEIVEAMDNKTEAAEVEEQAVQEVMAVELLVVMEALAHQIQLQVLP